MDVKTNPRILYITYDGLTDPLGQSQILPYIKGLAAAGYRFTILSFEKRERFKKERETIHRLTSESAIEWVPLWFTSQPPLLSKFYDAVRMRNKAFELQRSHHFDLLHCRSYLTSLIGLWAKRKFGTKFIFDMRGFWADERVEGGLWNLKNPLFKTIYRYFKKKEQQFFSEADYTISLTHSGAKQIQTNVMKGKAIAPIQVIPCCVDLNLFNALKVSSQAIADKRRELEILEDATVFSYIGSIGTWYLLEEMLLFFKIWLSNSSQSIFLFITADDPSTVFAKAEKISLPKENIRIVKGKRNEMPLLTSCSDYSIFFINPSFSKQASSPTKQGEIMALGKPIVCNNKVGDTGFVINQYNAGVVLNEFSEEAYKEKIRELKQKSFDACTIRKGAEEFYSLQKGINSYEEVYRCIL